MPAVVDKIFPDDFSSLVATADTLIFASYNGITGYVMMGEIAQFGGDPAITDDNGRPIVDDNFQPLIAS